MTYELYDKIDGRTIRVFPSRRAIKTWLCAYGGVWLASGYGYRRRWF